MIKLKTATLEAWVHPYGATLAGLWIKGTARSLVLGFAGPSGFKAEPIYAGAIVGPVANRIAKGRIAMDRNEWQMPCNDGENALHSGPDGLHAHVWDIRAQSDTQVTLTTDVPDGGIGLPGQRRIEARYVLNEDNTLDLFLSAISDKDTIMNLAHHPYWTLDKHDDVSRHILRVQAETYLPTGPDMIPTGQIAPVAQSDYDFRTFRPVPVDRTLDANLCLAQDKRQSPKPAAVLQGPTGLTLEVETTEPGLQVYNGSGLPTSDTRMHPGQRLAPFAGVALEPQGWPDAPHHAQFPSIALRALQMYRQHTRYKISRKS